MQGLCNYILGEYTFANVLGGVVYIEALRPGLQSLLANIAVVLMLVDAAACRVLEDCRDFV